MKKANFRFFIIFFVIPMAIGLLVIVAIIAVGIIEPQTPKVTAIGEPPSDSFVEWVEENIPLKSPSGRVRWSGKIVFRLTDPEEDPEGWSGGVKFYGRDGGPVSEVVIEEVVVSSTATEKIAKIIIRKETLGNYIVIDWWLDNQEYLSAHNPSELVTFLDGMGYHAVAEELSDLGYPAPIIPWDGSTSPSCEHLLTIQKLHQEGFIPGGGIYNLMLREGCQP